MPSFQIVFDGLKDKFKAGERITGYVQCNFSAPKKANQLSIKLSGEVRCKWTELGTGNGIAQTFEENEELIMGESNEILWQSNEVEKYIPGGDRRFPFNFVLGNSSLPSSFEGHHGSVRYKLTAKLERSWKSDLKVEEKLSVESVVDSNSNTFSDLPATASNFKKPWYQVLNVGQIQARLELSKRYYCSGEVIHARINIDNHSGSNTQGLALHLIRLEHYEAQGRVKERKKTLSTLRDESTVKKHTSGVYKTLPMTIPTSIPTVSRNNSRLLQISYFVELEIITSAMVSNFKVPLKFTLGSVKRPQSGQFEPLNMDPSAPSLKKSVSLPSQSDMRPDGLSFPVVKGPKLPKPAVGSLPPRNPEYFSPEIREDSMGSLPQYGSIDHTAWIRTQMEELQTNEQRYEWDNKDQIADLIIPSEYANFTEFAEPPAIKVIV